MRAFLENSATTLILGLLAVGVGPRAALAQETADGIPLDRWLVSGRLDSIAVDPASSDDPLAGPDGVAFPQRDLEVGPSYWTLIRDDGVRGLEARAVLAALDARGPSVDEPVLEPERDAAGASSILAHVYLKAPEDRTVLLAATHRDCQAPRVWLNGQLIELPNGSPGELPDESPGGLPESAVPLRLSGGWNTLLVHMRESVECAPAFPAALLPGADIDEESGASGTLAGIRVQASRPPGVRRQHPQGWVSVGTLEAAERLSWGAGSEDLTAAVRYHYAAWGRSPTSRREEGERDREAEPPAFDITGVWDLTLFGPTGIQRSTAEFRMAEDGRLEGRVTDDDRGEGRPQGPRLELRGNIEDGRVSGDRISFRLLISGAGGRAIQVRFRGVVESDFISGSIEFGGGPGPIGDFESSFEATPRRGGGEPGGEDEGEEESPEGRPQLPGRTRGDRAGRPGGLPGTGGQLSDEELRDRIRRQLLPPPEPTAPAPDTAAFELRLGGPRMHQLARGLVPGRRGSDEARIPFKRLRELALSGDGAEIRVRWTDEERELRRRLAPDGVLRALHAPIKLVGWVSEGEGRYSGTWRVPEALSGFTLRLASPMRAPAADTGPGPTVSVGGRTLAPGASDLCSPCGRGERLEIVLTGVTEATPSPGPLASETGTTPTALEVVVVEPGYPHAVAAAQGQPGQVLPAATEWLEALRGDNRRYRELAARHAGGT